MSIKVASRLKDNKRDKGITEFARDETTSPRQVNRNQRLLNPYERSAIGSKIFPIPGKPWQSLSRIGLARQGIGFILMTRRRAIWICGIHASAIITYAKPKSPLIFRLLN
jgi:hypothetical protein